MAYQYSNNASTTLASGITSGSTTITVSTGTGIQFPVLSGGNFFRGTLVDAATQTLREIVQVSATSGDTFTITRAQEGTTARAYNAGDIFYLDTTAAQTADFFSKTYDTFPNQPGRLINTQIITSTGTYAPTSGTTSIVFYLVGGGGGGGGISAAPNGYSGGGGGGGGGAVAIHRATSGFSGQTVTIGSGGTAGIAGGGGGGSGGNSTFLGVTAGGGAGGGGGTPTSNSGQFTSPQASPSGATGANIANIPGGPGYPGQNPGGFAAVGGSGGNNMFSSIPTATVGNGSSIPGYAASGYGGGGSGGITSGPGSAGAATAGGAGAAGVCIIYEYA